MVVPYSRTQTDATVTLSFQGSAIYIFEDVVDNHGLFTVNLDNRPPVQLNGISGCGGVFVHACEKTNVLAYYAGDLDSSLHTITVTNNGGVNHSFFDLDSFVYTTPSEYLSDNSYKPRQVLSRAENGSPANLVPGMNLLLFIVFAAIWLGRPVGRWV